MIAKTSGRHGESGEIAAWHTTRRTPQSSGCQARFRNRNSAATSTPDLLVLRVQIRPHQPQIKTGKFLSLSSVEDKVAFIGATHSWRLRTGSVVTLEDLDYYFQDELTSFTYRMSGELKDRTPEVVAAEAWAKFQDGRVALVLQHRDLIQRLLQQQKT